MRSLASWYAANKFCEKLAKKIGRKVKLPTEAQWEYACRAGSKTAYHFGDDASNAWYLDNASKKGEEYVHAVGQKKPNAFGLYDMYGNVKEWCRDWRDAKAKEYDRNTPGRHSVQMLRGGWWIAQATDCRSAACFRTIPSVFDSKTDGFRVVVESAWGVE